MYDSTSDCKNLMVSTFCKTGIGHSSKDIAFRAERYIFRLHEMRTKVFTDQKSTEAEINKQQQQRGPTNTGFRRIFLFSADFRLRDFGGEFGAP